MILKEIESVSGYVADDVIVHHSVIPDRHKDCMFHSHTFKLDCEKSLPFRNGESVLSNCAGI